MIKVEVIATNLAEVKLLSKYKFISRIELIDNLEVGGLTPKTSVIKEVNDFVNSQTNLELAVMIRPKWETFNYSFMDKVKISNTLAYCSKIGVKHVVFGCIGKNGFLDVKFLQTFCQTKKDMKFTFHRAIEYTSNLPEALKWIESLRVDYILIGANEDQKISQIKTTITNPKPELMIGGGLTFANLVDKIETYEPTWVHFGTAIRNDDYSLNEDKIKQLEQIIKGLKH